MLTVLAIRHFGRRMALLVLAGATLASAARAQVVLNLSTNAGKTLVKSSTPPDLTQVLDLTADPLTVRVLCQDSSDCTKVSAVLISAEDAKGTPATPHNPLKTAVSLDVSPASWANKTKLVLHVKADKDSIAAIALRVPSSNTNQASAQANASDSKNPFAASVASLLIAKCDVAEHGIGTYVPAEHLARFIVSPTGNIFQRPPPIIDEDDLVEITVVGAADLLPALRVQRTSAFRSPDAIHILGEEAVLPSLGTRKAASDSIPKCAKRSFVLSDFAPGRGEVTMSVITTTGTSTVGSFDFGINTLYVGSFSLGAVYSWVRDPTFGLVARGQDSIITRTADPSPPVLFTLSYTSFVHGKRDLEKNPSSLMDRINPMFGVVLNDVSNNFIAGLNVDIASAVYLSVGAHAGRVHRLNPESHLNLGDVFTGNSQQLPVIQDWQVRGFIGLSLDLRAASALFDKVLGTTGK